MWAQKSPKIAKIVSQNRDLFSFLVTWWAGCGRWHHQLTPCHITSVSITYYISFSNKVLRIQKTQNSAICLFFYQTHCLLLGLCLSYNWDIFGMCSFGPACRDVTEPMDRRVLQKLFQTLHSLPYCGQISCIFMLSMKLLS